MASMSMVLPHYSSDIRYTGDGSGSLDKVYDLTACEVLGTGMSGSVRLARQRATGTTHAVKSFKKRYSSLAALEDFKREVDVHLSMHHPHIACLEHVYETSDEIHLVMEHLRGGEVFDHVVRKGGFSEAEAAGAMRQMLTAVAHVHEKGVAHLDVKLENFCFETDACDRLKLIDFGFASECGGGTVDKICGSLQMMAPEMMKGKGCMASDVWSLGVIAYMMLCGSSPWGHTDFETRRMISSGQPAYRADFFKLSPGARHFVQSLLHPNPATRSTAKGMLEHAWLSSFPKPSSEPSCVAAVAREDSDESTQADSEGASTEPRAVSFEDDTSDV